MRRLDATGAGLGVGVGVDVAPPELGMGAGAAATGATDPLDLTPPPPPQAQSGARAKILAERRRYATVTLQTPWRIMGTRHENLLNGVDYHRDQVLTPS
jgi:hypothetical protein